MGKKPYIPPTPVCMPPNTCATDEQNYTGAELLINNTPFYQCQKGDPMCISNVYSSNDYGLPVDQNMSNPPMSNQLFTQQYHTRQKNQERV